MSTLASQAQAEAGTDNVKLMTPLRLFQAITNGQTFLASWTGAVADVGSCGRCMACKFPSIL